MIERQASIPPSRHLRQAERPEPRTPASASFDIARASARARSTRCRRCPLYETPHRRCSAKGRKHAELMFVGEQPGDQEDLAGKPFVGPAGKVFDAAMAEAGLERSRAYAAPAAR